MLQYLEKGIVYLLAAVGCFFMYDFYSTVKDMQKAQEAQMVALVEMKSVVGAMRTERFNFVEKFNSDMATLFKDRESKINRLEDLEQSSLIFAGIEQQHGKDGIILKISIPSGMDIGVDGQLRN